MDFTLLLSVGSGFMQLFNDTSALCILLAGLVMLGWEIRRGGGDAEDAEDE